MAQAALALPITEEAAEQKPWIVNGQGSIEGEMIDGKWLGKWYINDPRKVKYVERTEFLKSICGHVDHSETLEEALMNNPPKYRMFKRGEKADEVQQEYDNKLEIYELAKTYYRYRNKGARLPKFSRWVTGMFAGNAAFAKILAEEGQRAASRKIIMSVNVVDILRNTDTPHFQSCFAWAEPNNKGSYYNSGYHNIPTNIAEECPGIGIIYVDDENGKMMGRHWMHHAKDKKTGEDMIVLTMSRYGCLEGENVARLLAARGIKVAMGSYYGERVTGDNVVEIEYIGCFNREIHHDLKTWGREKHYARIVKPAF